MPGKWDNTYACFDDVNDCAYTAFCPCFAVCELGGFVWDLPEVKDDLLEKNKYMIGGQAWSVVSSVCCCPNMVCCGFSCKPYVGPCYNTHLFELVSKKLDKDPNSVTPCGKSACCDAQCQFMWQCTAPCTLCMMHREMQAHLAKQGRTYKAFSIGKSSELTEGPKVKLHDQQNMERA